jgi:hypothetical protein
VKKPELIPDWRHVLRRAWSIRLMLLAGVLSGVEVILPVVTDSLPWPRWASASLVALVVSGAFVTRLLAQKDSE